MRIGRSIDGFRVGTAMGVSGERPTSGLSSTATSYADEGRVKLGNVQPVLPRAANGLPHVRSNNDARDIIGRLADGDFQAAPLLQLREKMAARLVQPKLRPATLR